MQASFRWAPWAASFLLVVFTLAGCKPRTQDAASNTTLAPATSDAAGAPPPVLAGSDAKSYVDFGRANGGRGDLEAALEAFDSAISIDPKYAPAYFNRGVAKFLQHDPDQASADFTKAIELDPNYKEAYFQRGCIEGQRGNFDAAIADFSADVRLDPKFALAHYNLGHAAYFKGDLDAALPHLNEALRLDPNLKVAYYIRAIVLHAQGHREEALGDFRKSAGLNFANAALWVWIIETEQNQSGLARKDLTDALAKPQCFNPTEWPSPLGNFLLGKLTQDELLAAAKKGEPADLADRLCEAWYYAGVSRQVIGDGAGAKDCFTQAVAQNSQGSEESLEAKRALAAMATP